MLDEGFRVLESHSSSRREERTDGCRENDGAGCHERNSGCQDEDGPGTSCDGQHDGDNDTRNNYADGEEEMEVQVSQI